MPSPVSQLAPDPRIRSIRDLEMMVGVEGKG